MYRTAGTAYQLSSLLAHTILPACPAKTTLPLPQLTLFCHPAPATLQATLSRMGEQCDPHVYYQRVRLPMSGWRNNAALPEGLVYEGQFGNQVGGWRGGVGWGGGEWGG